MKKKQWFFIEITAAVLAIIILAAVMVPKFLARQSINTPAHIPDDNFRRIMAENMSVELNGHYTADQARNTPLKLKMSIQNIKSLKGIEYFVGATTLFCCQNHLTHLDVSTNVNLVVLFASRNQLTNVILPTTNTLCEIHLNGNQLSSIDTAELTHLEVLHLDSNHINSLSTNNHPQLKKLQLNHNQISTIDLSKNKELMFVYLNHNPLTHISLPKTESLLEIHLAHTKLDRIPDLRVYPNLKSVDLRGLKIHEEDIQIIKDLEQKMGKEVYVECGIFDSGIAYDSKNLDQWNVELQ